MTERGVETAMSCRVMQKVAPRFVPELDPGFRPAVLATRGFLRRVDASGAAVPVVIGLEQADGSVSRFETRIFAPSAPEAPENFEYLERFIKFLLWSRGGFRVYLGGDPELAPALRRYFTETPTGRFDADIMGARVYEKPFEVVACAAGDVPAQKAATRPLGRHLEGCRIGFDLGASDLKAGAVIDGKAVYTEEFPWDPVRQADPQYHLDHIMHALRAAAKHMPRVDAIGGSAAGVYVNNRVKVASLFRAVPKDVFDRRVKDLFIEIRAAWNGIPLEVVNDGEVTALAGSMSLGANSVLGVAMGSSEAAGYVTPQGNITSWLNELAFVPVDVRDGAPADEWSGDRGCGVQYFSQQAVGRLLPASGLEVDAALSLPDKLKAVQDAMARNDPRAAALYRTIGVYFGYAAAHYADFYAIEHLLVLGRVMTGEGGAIILEKAHEVLNGEFPDLAATLRFCTPDERDKRHGQAIAAASLPALGR